MSWRGLEFSDDNLALTEIAAVGPGGSYMGRQHTKQRMKTTAVLPRLANRENARPGEEAGRPDIDSRALAEARRIPSQPNPAVWDAALDAAIRNEFPRHRGRRRRPLSRRRGVN